MKGTVRIPEKQTKECHAKSTGDDSRHTNLTDKMHHYVFFKLLSAEGQEKKTNQHNWLAYG